MLDRIKKIYIEYGQMSENLYLVVLGIYFLKLTFDTTIFSIPWPIYFDNILRAAAIGVILFKISCSDSYKGKEWVACICAGSLFSLSWMATGYIFLLDIVILITGAVGVPYKRILKLYLLCAGSVCALAVIGSLTGAVQDLIYTEKDLYKHSFGICYTTDFAAHIVYLILVSWIVYEHIPAIVFAGIMALFTVFQYYFTGTQCSEIVMLLSLIGVGYVWAAPWLEKKSNITKMLVQLSDWMLIVFMPLCAGVMIWLSKMFSADNTYLNWINQILSGRLRLAQAAFAQYGIKLFGTAFDMVGNGGETVSRSGYNFVDSSYCMILVRYGAAALAVTLFIYIVTEKKAFQRGKRTLMAAFALIAIHSMIEHHLLELAYNPLILLPFSNFNVAEERAGQSEKVPNYLGYGLGAGLLLLISPRIIGYGKTITTLLRLSEGRRNVCFIFAMVILAAAVFAFIKELVDIVVARVGKESVPRRKYYAMAGSCIILILSVMMSEYVLWKKSPYYGDSVDKGSSIISEILSVKQGKCKIYVDDIPEIYKRRVNGISNWVMSAEGAASKEHVVMITRKDKDFYRLTNAGYLFGELSDQEAIYTNCDEAIRVLEADGIDMSPCYSVIKQVDLQDLSIKNDLGISDSGGLLVEGQDKSLIHGPYDILYRGTFRVEYKLKLIDSSISDGELATARFSAEWGRNILDAQSLTRADFDTEGNCTVVMEKQLRSLEGVEYLLFAKGDTRIEIESITCQKIGN